jgi:aryl-alcohol dehydrogenase-like predicted oxidoreductase
MLRRSCPDSRIYAVPGFSIAYTTGNKTSEAESLATLARAQELGVTMLDSANAYGFGANEQLLGEMCIPPSDALQQLQLCAHVKDADRLGMQEDR